MGIQIFPHPRKGPSEKDESQRRRAFPAKFHLPCLPMNIAQRPNPLGALSCLWENLSVDTLAQSLLSWYRKMGRSLPWRDDPTPYHVLLSETMLQQTRVNAVLPRYLEMLKTAPRIEDLASLKEEEMLKLWEGLGYYSRARNLRKAAIFIQESVMFPEDYEGLRKLPGVGEYTAKALLAIAFHKKAVAVDGNLERVFSRLETAEKEGPTLRKEAEAYLLEAMGEGDPSSFNQALMDLGELICLPNGAPRCEECPLKAFCKAHKAGKEQDYPKKKARSAKKTIHLQVFILHFEGKTVFRIRPDKGLLASLAEFPNAPGKSPKEALSSLGFKAKFLSYLGHSGHSFTHLRWEMDWHEGELIFPPKEGYLLLDEEEAKALPIPSAFSFGKKKAEIL